MTRNNKTILIITNIFTAGLVLVASAALFVAGNDSGDYYYALLGVMLFWVYGMIYGVINLSKLYGYAIMNFMLFVFFISRPAIASLYDTGWTVWNEGIVEKSLLLVFVSEIALFIGSVIIKQPNRVDDLYINRTVNYDESIQRMLLLIVLLTAVLSAYSTMKNYMHYSALNYEDIYVSKNSNDNALVRASATMFPFAVFSYLATIPSKKNSIIILTIYVMLGLPTFMLGNRASLVLRIAFVVAYFFIRDYIRESYNSRWISKPLKVGFLVFVAFSIVFLGAFNYYRAGLNPGSETNIPIMLDFFYRQGTTFDTICQGLQYQEDIMKLPHSAGYSFGPVYDTVVHSTLSQAIFNTTNLGSGNSINMVMNGNSLSHKLSYIVLGEANYLAGYGRGSSYLLETYYDGGLAYVAIFSFLIGLYLSSINKMIQKGKWFLNVIVISTLSRIFYIPRSSAFDFISFIFTPHFWLIISLSLLAMFFAEAKERIALETKKTGL